jgi:predicted transglutaminase-like cysteine proteinase
MTLTPERWSELTSVDREVNRDIVPVVSMANGATENWLISPLFGDCKDYAVTKRHRLLALGWPSRALLLSEVVVPSGEHHLVLVVRTRHVDLVLDNLNANVRSVAMTYQQYRWVRVESPQDPKFWARVDMPGIVHTASLN